MASYGSRSTSAQEKPRHHGAFSIFAPMNYCLGLLLLASLSSCHHAAPTASQEHLTTQADPLLGHWQCDSIATVPVDSQGRVQGYYQVEHNESTLDVTPTQYVAAVGIAFSDTATNTYTRHGQELTTTFTLLNRKPIPGFSGQVEHFRIITLTPTVFRTETTLRLPAGSSQRVRHFYHR
jgi:hypothetical protein